MDISFVTRKFQRSIAGLGLATILAASVFTGSALGMTFDDVSSDNYAFDSVDWVSDEGIMTGYADGTFGRANYLTRQEAAKVLIEAFDLPMDSSDTVTCTGTVDTWAQPYIATANTLGILTGEGDGSCNATGNVNRAAFAKMVIVAGGFADTGVLGTDVFLDVESDWSNTYIGQAWSNSIVNGMTSTTFGPGNYIIRADAAVMVDRAVNSAEVRYPETSGDDDDDDDTTGTGGALEVILSNDSPEDYTYFSAGTNAEVATFELTASDSDVLVSAFEVELASGDADSVTALALYNEEGTRISKVDTSIDSDDLARMTMLDGGYTVAAGTSETFRLMNSFVDAATANTSTLYSYAFDSSMIESDASSVEVENDLTTGIFGLLDNNTGAVTVTDLDYATDVQVGETDAELFTFEVAETSTDKDVWLTAITFENTGTANLEDALDDLALYFDGDLVAEGTQFGDYISFQMDSDAAALIEAGNTESFEVRARITGESSEDLTFGLEETLDVRAVDEDDNDVAVTSAFVAGTTSIEAGAVSVVAYDAETDKFRADREDVELGRFEVTAGTSGLTLNTINLRVILSDEDTAGDAEVWAIEDLFENFTVELNGAKNYLDPVAPADADVMYGVDTDKSLTEGTVYEFVVYADTLSVDAAETASGNVVEDYTDFSVEIRLESLGAPTATTDGLVVEEDASGDLVGDFTPSAVSFNSLQGETAGAEVSGLSLSSAKNVVVGGTEELLEFQVEESADVSDLTIKDLNVNILVNENGDGDFSTDAGEEADSTNVSSVDLYQVNADDTETLLDSVSGSNLGATTTEGTVVNFDFSDITVTQNSEETFRVYVTFVDDETLGAAPADTFKAVVSTYDIRDDENNEVYDSDDTTPFGDFTDDTEPTSGRTITLVSTGALYVEVDNDDDTYGTDSKRFIQNGTTGAGLMTLALRSVNEDVTVEDYTLMLSAGSIKEMFTEFYVYDEDGVLVGSKTVTSETTEINFTDVATELTAYADVTTRYYVVADTTTYGLNEIGTADANTTANRTWTMDITTAKGDESNNTLALNDNSADATLESGEIGYGSTTAGARAGDDGATATDASEGFGMAATLISNVEFVSTYGGKTVGTTLNNGSNNVAILAVTVDDTNNTESTGDDVKVDLDSLVFQYTKLAGTTITGATVERIGGSNSTAAGVDAADGATNKFTFSLAAWTTDNLIAPGTTAYFLVKAVVTKDAVDSDSDDYVQFTMDDINSTNALTDNFAWKDFSSATANIAVYMGGTSSLEAAQLSE